MKNERQYAIVLDGRHICSVWATKIERSECQVFLYRGMEPVALITSLEVTVEEVVLRDKAPQRESCL